MTARRFALVLTFVLGSLAPTLASRSAPLWGSLRAGEYAVGFTVRNTYDESRTFVEKHRADGSIQPGTRVRPVQIAIWYPATVPEGREPLSFADYVHLMAHEVIFSPMTDETRARAEALLRQGIDVDDRKMKEILELPVVAYARAPMAEGLFPLLVVAPGFNGHSMDFAVLGEYLASHGYVVAASPSMGSRTRAMDDGRLGLETQARDLEHVIREVRGIAGVDRDRLAALGFSFGGAAVTVLGARFEDVDAVISLDGSDGFRGRIPMLQGMTHYDPLTMMEPRLRMHVGQPEATDLTIYDELVYSERTIVTMPRLGHGDFSVFGMLVERVAAPDSSEVSVNRLGHELVCRTVHTFLRAHLDGDEKAHRALRREPSRALVPEGFYRVEHRQALPRVPTPTQFKALFMREGAEAALAVYREGRANNPALRYPEDFVNQAGYASLTAGRHEEALALFALNIEAWPESWNVYDSYGEALAAAGRTGEAIDSYRRSLELEPRNENGKRQLERLEREQRRRGRAEDPG